MNEFFRTPFKATILVISAAFVALTFSARPAPAEQRVPLMNLDSGAVQFFKEISPSIVQVFTGGSAGSGYVIDREGHVITNFHVTTGADAFEIAFYGDQANSREYAQGRWHARKIAEDPALDLAVLLVDAPAEKFHPVRLGDSALMKPGDTVATFGSPGGDPGWVDRSSTNFEDSWLEFFNLNLGVISEILNFQESYWTMFGFPPGFDPSYRANISDDYGSAVQYLFHTDSAINHGNSGGPCLNVYGEAVGTNTWGFPGENVGFTVPINLLKRSAADMIEYGRVRRPWVGISLNPSHTAQGEAETNYKNNTLPFNGMISFDPEPARMKIYTVNPYSPAYAAGLREGDVVIRVDGQKFKNVFDVYSYFLNSDLGDQIVIEYERDGHGAPPAVVTVDEKKLRYFNRTIDAYAYGPWSGDMTRYTADMTY